MFSLALLRNIYLKSSSFLKINATIFDYYILLSGEVLQVILLGLLFSMFLFFLMYIFASSHHQWTKFTAHQNKILLFVNALKPTGL